MLATIEEHQNPCQETDAHGCYRSHAITTWAQADTHSQAVYENGVFNPAGKIDLREHQEVELVLSEPSSVTQRTQGS